MVAMMTSQNGLRNRSNSNAIGTRKGLTLLEMVLVMALLVMLTGMVVMNVGTWRHADRLEEGVDRFGTVLRMAGAEAAATGRRIRLSFDEESDDEETGRCSVLWEPKPLAEPEQFTAYSRCSWVTRIPNGLVRVVRSELTGSSAYRTLRVQTGREETEDNALQPVTFYPDGSSDSAIFELVDARGSESRLAVIQLDGVNRVTTERIVSVEEYEQDRKSDKGPKETERG
jgi:Tfp pilus assembly protein FimT